MNHTRAHTNANEVSSFTTTVGTAWATPASDLAGNMTTLPKPAALNGAYTAKYDVWNRLVEIKDGANTVLKHRYDRMGLVKGRGRRSERNSGLCRLFGL